jgi:beta-glucosidase/6-phospho-beta-glucosidase/beta-galactosidase
MKDFPPGFMLGVGTAAFQIEGAYNEGASDQRNESNIRMQVTPLKRISWLQLASGCRN